MDDLISRQTVKEQMIKYGFHAIDMTVTEFVEDELPSVQPKDTCEDCISRQAAVSVANDFDVTMVVRGLEKLPSVQPEQKMGRWITKTNKEQVCEYLQIMCDRCGFIKTAIEGHTIQYKFCPNCGAKMEEDECMDELISRRAVLDIIHHYKNDRDSQLSDLTDGVCNLPSVQPEQKVIKCQDCNEWNKGKTHNGHDVYSDEGHCSVHRIITGENYYCGDAERR